MQENERKAEIKREIYIERDRHTESNNLPLYETLSQEKRECIDFQPPKYPFSGRVSHLIQSRRIEREGLRLVVENEGTREKGGEKDKKAARKL